jgi:peroxiredoxin
MPSRQQEQPPRSEETDGRSSSDISSPVSILSEEEQRRAQQAPGLVIRGPASGQRLHAFILPDAAGQPVQLWNYLQRSNVMLFFHHGGTCAACQAFLHELGTQLNTYRQQETALIAIGPGSPDENRQLAARSGPPFPCLSDPAGRVIAQQGLTSPALVLADRWGEIWAAWQCGPGHQFPSQQDILQWLSFIQAQCPECTMIEWTDL